MAERHGLYTLTEPKIMCLYFRWIVSTFSPQHSLELCQQDSSNDMLQDFHGERIQACVFFLHENLIANHIKALICSPINFTLNYQILCRFYHTLNYLTDCADTDFQYIRPNVKTVKPTTQ